MKHSPEFYQRSRLNGIDKRFTVVAERLRPSKIGLWGIAASEGSDAWFHADRDRRAFDAALGRHVTAHSIRIRQYDDLSMHVFVDGERLEGVSHLRIKQDGGQQITLEVIVTLDWGTVTHRYPIRDLTIITPESFQ